MKNQIKTKKEYKDWYTKEGELIIRDGVALRNIEQWEEIEIGEEDETH